MILLTIFALLVCLLSFASKQFSDTGLAPPMRFLDSRGEPRFSPRHLPSETLTDRARFFDRREPRPPTSIPRLSLSAMRRRTPV